MIDFIKNFFEKYLSDKNIRWLERVDHLLKREPVFFLKYVFLNTIGKKHLEDIGKYYKTDKVRHSFKSISYLDIYEKYLSRIRNKKISLLEIGVLDGNSLRMWGKYFKKGNIFGIDINPSAKKHEEKGIKVEIGSQDDIVFLERCFKSNNKFDIIIDDGSHIINHIITSFEYLFYNRLKSGGIYVIEDLATSYEQLQSNHNIMETWPGMKYNDPNQSFDNDRNDMNEFFFKKIHDLDHQMGKILSIHFWSMCCFITKV